MSGYHQVGSITADTPSATVQPCLLLPDLPLKPVPSSDIHTTSPDNEQEKSMLSNFDSIFSLVECWNSRPIIIEKLSTLTSCIFWNDPVLTWENRFGLLSRLAEHGRLMWMVDMLHSSCCGGDVGLLLFSGHKRKPSTDTRFTWSSQPIPTEAASPYPNSSSCRMSTGQAKSLGIIAIYYQWLMLESMTWRMKHLLWDILKSELKNYDNSQWRTRLIRKS